MFGHTYLIKCYFKALMTVFLILSSSLGPDNTSCISFCKMCVCVCVCVGGGGGGGGVVIAGKRKLFAMYS